MNGEARASPSGTAPGVAELLRIGERLYGPAVALCGRGQDAEDLVHDTVEVMLRQWSALTGDRLAYARRTLANKHIDQARRFKVGLSHQAELLGPDVPDPARSLADRVDLHTALQTLSDRTRTVIVLRHLLDHSVAEVAQLLDLPEGTVRRISHDGLRALARRLGKPDSEGPMP